jgi:mRNA interferase MazF
MVISRFDVFLTTLEPTLWQEIKKARPCVVISPDEMNAEFWTVIVAPMSSKIKQLPTRVPVTFAGKKGQILLDQIRAIDTLRLVKRLGGIDVRTGAKVLNKLQELFSP